MSLLLKILNALCIFYINIFLITLKIDYKTMKHYFLKRIFYNKKTNKKMS